MSDATPDPPQEPSPKELRRQAKAAVKAAEQWQRERVREATKAVEAARKEQAQLVKRAESDLKDAEKAHEQAVAAAEERAAGVEKGRALAVCAPYTLFADRVWTPEGAVWLAPGMQATVDTSGSKQVEHHPTATRACACGLFTRAGSPEKGDSRHTKGLPLHLWTRHSQRGRDPAENGGGRTEVRGRVQRRCCERPRREEGA